jgi:hypothetical protein
MSSLAEITVYSNSDDDLFLKEILLKIKAKTNGEQAISHKSSPEELMAYFAEVVPEYNKERVYVSHIKKMIEWYNILQKNHLLDIEDEQTEEREEDTEAAES